MGASQFLATSQNQGGTSREHPEGPVLADSDQGFVERAQSAFLRDLPFPPPWLRLLCPLAQAGLLWRA